MPNLLLLDGCTIFLSQENGDVRSRAPELGMQTLHTLGARGRTAPRR